MLAALRQASLSDTTPSATAANSPPAAAAPIQDQSGKRLLAALQRPAPEPSAAAAPPARAEQRCNGAADGPSAQAAKEAPPGGVASPRAGQELLAALLQGRATGAAKALQQSSAAKLQGPSASAALQTSAAAPDAMGRSLLAQLQGQPQAAPQQQQQAPSLVPGFQQLQQAQPAAPAKLQSAGSGAALLQLLQQKPPGPVAANGAPPRPGAMVVGRTVQQPQGYGNRWGPVGVSGQAAPDPGHALLAQLQKAAQPPPASALGAPQPPAMQRHQAPAQQQMSNAQGLSLLAQLQGSRPAAATSAAGSQQRALTAEEQFIVQLQSDAAAAPRSSVPSGPPAAPSFLALLQRGGNTAGDTPHCCPIMILPFGAMQVMRSCAEHL